MLLLLGTSTILIFYSVFPESCVCLDEHYRVRATLGHEERAEREVPREVPPGGAHAEQAAQPQARATQDRHRVRRRHRHHSSG